MVSCPGNSTTKPGRESRETRTDRPGEEALFQPQVICLRSRHCEFHLVGWSFEIHPCTRPTGTWLQGSSLLSSLHSSRSCTAQSTGF